MATIYICKCGRRVRKSTNADNTGNRDTENCKGCPYLLPWGPFEFVKSQGFVRNVKGYECRMSKDIEYATRFCGSIDDKCSCYIASLDFDFLTRVSNWIKETYPGGELNGSFFTDDIRAVEYVSNGRYRMSIGCAQNKKGIAAKAALLHQFFDASGARLDMTPEEEKAHILAAIEAGKAKASGKEKDMQVYTNQYGTLFAVREHNGSPALMCKAKESEQWVMSGVLAAVKDDAKTIGELQAVLDKAAQKYNWEPVENVPVENPTDAAEDVQQCAPTASNAPLSQSQSVNADAQQGGGDDSGEPAFTVRKTIPAGTEARRRVQGYAAMRCGEVSVIHVCRQKPESVQIWLNSMMPSEYWVMSKSGDVCGEHVEICPYCEADLKNGEGDVLIVPFGHSENFTPAASAFPVDAGAAVQGPSAVEPASLAADECTENPTSSAAATAAAEETVAAPEPSDLASMIAVSAAKTNAEVVDATNKVAASSNLPEVCRDCQCVMCGNEDCASPCWLDPKEVNDCKIVGPAGGDCKDYQPKEDAQCQKENAPSADAAATSDGSAARMCEGPGEETRTTQAAASGAALESLHAQAVLPQNAPAQDIAADAPSALGFDFGADESTNAELLQCAQTFVIGKVAQVMAAKRAHDLTANNKNGAFGKWCAAVGISRDKGNQLVNIADNFGNIELEGKPIIEVTPISLLALGAKPSTPDVLTEGIGRGEITTIKQFRELEAQLKAVQTERDEAWKAKEKAEQERDAARDAQAASSRLTNMITNQRDEAQIRAEKAELRAQAAEEDAAGWKQAGLEMQELVDQRDERIRELESGITVEAAAVDQEEIERRANELSEPLVKIINQKDEQIERMASGNTVAAQASVLAQYIESMKVSLLGNASRVELACYDVRALDSLARSLREFADSIDGIFEDRSEDND